MINICVFAYCDVINESRAVTVCKFVVNCDSKVNHHLYIYIYFK